MGHIEDRWYRNVAGSDGRVSRLPTDRHGLGMRYRVRYTGPDGRERSQSFPDREKRRAEAFLSTVEADMLRGSYVDPRAGRMTFREYVERWLGSQTFDESTREATETRLRVHLLPIFGQRSLASIAPSDVRAWDRDLQRANVAQTYRRVLFATLSAIMAAAVDDERIAKNPCRATSVKAPRVDPRKITPWTWEQVAAVRGALPVKARGTVDVGAGCGLRQGEIFGLAVTDIDFLRGVVHVTRQVKLVRSRLVFALPKGRRTRSVPLADEVGLRLAAHIKRDGTCTVTLPWEQPAGMPVSAELLFFTREHTAWNRNYFNTYLWHPALGEAGIGLGRQAGMHALRHFFASVVLDAGESIKALSEYLGHADPGFTLRTYTHLMPSSEARTKQAVGRVFRTGDTTADGPATAQQAD